MSEIDCVCGGDGVDDLRAGPGAGSLVDNETGLAEDGDVMRGVMIYFYSGCSQQQQW